MEMSMKRRGWMIVVAWVGAEVYSYQRAVPRGIGTLRDYIAWRPESKCVAMTDSQGREYVIAYGPFAGVLLASGPSAYVFDDEGQFTEWSSDIGDSPRFDKKWSAQRGYDGRPLSREEIQGWGAMKKPEDLVPRP